MATLFGMFPFLKTLFADGGYQGPQFAKALAKVLPHLDVEIVKRSDRVAEASIRAIGATSIRPQGTYLVKLGHREHMFEFYKHRRLKISSASTYSDPSLNAAIYDDELSLHAYGLQSEVLIEVFDPATGQRKAPPTPSAILPTPHGPKRTTTSIA